VNRPAPWTALHSNNLPACIRLRDRVLVSGGGDVVPLAVRAWVPGAAVAFPSRAGRAS
jgi:hypothetical protein